MLLKFKSTTGERKRSTRQAAISSSSVSGLRNYSSWQTLTSSAESNSIWVRLHLSMTSNLCLQSAVSRCQRRSEIYAESIGVRERRKLPLTWSKTSRNAANTGRGSRSSLHIQLSMTLIAYGQITYLVADIPSIGIRATAPVEIVSSSKT